jgi:hypothetical protein
MLWSFELEICYKALLGGGKKACHLLNLAVSAVSAISDIHVRTDVAMKDFGRTSRSMGEAPPPVDPVNEGVGRTGIRDKRQTEIEHLEGGKVALTTKLEHCILI